MKIIPAIDVLNGKCVRLTQGDFGKVKVYSQDPLKVALQFQDANLEHLHMVDLDGAKKGKVVNWDVVIELQEKCALMVDFGGGVKTENDVEELLELDINQINVGSLAVTNPEKFKKWLTDYGAENFILSADVIEENIMMNGWSKSAKINVFDLIEECIPNGLTYVTCTDISRDGMLEGPNLDLYQKLRERFPTLKINASGGITTVDDLQKLKSIGMDGAIIGKAIYEGRIQLSDLKNFA